MRLDEVEKELASPRKNKIPRGDPLPPDSPFHGTSNGYRFHRCRCDRCRTARAQERSEQVGNLTADSPIHGTVNGYRYYQCRCDRCRAAKAAEARSYRQRVKDQRAVNASGEASGTRSGTRSTRQRGSTLRSDVRDGIPRASRPFESPMTLAIRNSRATVTPDPSLVAARADEAEADTPEAVAADPSVIDAERHPLYGHGVKHREEVCAVWCNERNCGCIGEKPPTHSEYVRQSRLSRWQEQR